jgi:hypothetical protein
MNEGSLIGGLYLNHFWMPNNGRYGLIPVLPQLATSSEVSFCERVTLSQFSSDAARQAFYNQRYPDNGITGTSWVAPVPSKGCAYFANPNDNEQSSFTSTFTYPLQRNSCQSLSGTLQSYTYGILDEAPDSINILVGDTMGACALPRSNVNTFVLKGLTETRAPVLKISGQQSFTQNWDAATQTYTLAVTHNGTVLITLHTSGRGAALLHRASAIPTTASLLSAHVDGQRHLQIAVNQSGPHTVRVTAASGATVGVFSGVDAHTYAVDTRSIPCGMYIVSAAAQGTTESMRVIVGR